MMVSEGNSEDKIGVIDRSSAAQKTPISLLQELCAQQGISADYKLMSVEGAVHAPTFMYRVQVAEIVASATGASKKKAKHAAAKAVLEKLLSDSGGYSAGFMSDGVMVNSHTLAAVIASSTLGDVVDTITTEDVQGNPVGELQEWCMRNHCQPPHYETKEETGLPHERTFTIECRIDRFTECGIGKSKRLAKRQAADKMFRKLSSLEPKGDKENQKFEYPVVGDRTFKNKPRASVHSMYYDKVQEFLSDIKCTQVSPCLQALDQIDVLDEKLDCVTLLRKVAAENQFELHFVPLDNRGRSGKGVYHCLVRIDSLPVAVCFGIGKSREDAQVNSARNALSFLQIMRKT